MKKKVLKKSKVVKTKTLGLLAQLIIVAAISYTSGYAIGLLIKLVIMSQGSN